MKLGNRSFSLSSLIKAMLAVGLLQVAAYYFAGTMASPDNHVAVPQPDTLLYCQSARMIVEGHPFVFSPGEKPSTGCTSHLYPFVLSVPYALGAKGDALLTAGFALNALFYFIFLACWGVSAWKLAGGGERPLQTACAALAGMLICLNGQSVFCALSQSDAGFFMAVSAALFALLLCGRLFWFGVLLAISPWCRPEGMMLSIFFAGVWAVRRIFYARFRIGEAPRRGEWAIVTLALGSCAGVFAFNYWLTGMAQFQSIAYKGYFKESGFLPALSMSLQDFLKEAKAFVLGMPAGGPRDFYFLPMLGAAFAWLGIFTRDWKGGWKLPWMLVTALAAIFSVATSMWQDTNCDRYLAWAFPLWLIFMADGCVWAGNALSRCKAVPAAALLFSQVVSSAAFCSFFYTTSLQFERSYDFAKEAQAVLPSQASIGSLGECGIIYGMPGRRLRHFAGIFSPDFLCKDFVTNLDLLKHRPDLRFDVWHFHTASEIVFGGTPIDSLCGREYALSLRGENFRETKWAALDAALLPCRSIVFGGRAGLGLADSLDVGYLADEKRCRYQTHSRFYQTRYAPFGMQGVAGGRTIVDVGRPVIGWDEMDLRLKPGRDAVLILRTAPAAQSQVDGGFPAVQKFIFDSPLTLRVKCDGSEVSLSKYALESQTNAFSELAIQLPGQAIRGNPAHLEIFGDHAAFAYWAYQ